MLNAAKLCSFRLPWEYVVSAASLPLLLEQDNDLKHTSKMDTKMKGLDCLFQSPDLNLFKNILVLSLVSLNGYTDDC